MHGTITGQACSRCDRPITVSVTSKFDTGTNAESRNIWERLWKLAIPGKIKIHGWRVLNGFIPCRCILSKRHIGDNGDCPMCPSGYEDIKHMMFTCDRAKTIWNFLGVWRQIEELAQGDRSGQQMIEEVIKGGRKVPSLNNVDLSWCFWWERRSFVHGEPVQNPHRSAMSIVALTCNYIRSKNRTIKMRKEWKKPFEGKLRVNIDAGFAAGSGSTEVVIRDSSGGFIEASMSYLPAVLDAQMAEAYALKEGLSLAHHIGCRNFTVQSDCLEVVETTKDSGFTASAAAGSSNF